MGRAKTALYFLNYGFSPLHKHFILLREIIQFSILVEWNTGRVSPRRGSSEML